MSSTRDQFDRAEHKAARYASNLQLLNRCLARTPFANRYAVFGGLLLGVVREGEPLMGDFDADFYYLEYFDKQFDEAVAHLTDAGFKPLYRFQANDGLYWEHTFWKDGAKFEFFRCRVANERELHYYDFVPMPPPRQQLKRFLNGPLQKFTFLECEWLAAADVDTALTMHYGDWRTPDRLWRWDRDPLTLAIYPWQSPGMRWRV